ncbi:MAG: hypothetical protein GX612_04820 [Bacteroidales bacterium]|nr:hypothetical protein [Bacteroidales bacterium]
MQIYDLFSIPEEMLTEVGGKAKGLYLLHKAGLHVPRGFIVCDIQTDEDIEKAGEYYERNHFANVAVRSSAKGEDGKDFSFAGQFSSFLNIQDVAAVKKAIKDCLQSLQNETAQAYAGVFLNTQSSKMTVVIQEFINATKAGVGFSSDPMGKPYHYLVEAVEGWGENLVNGTTAAQQFRISASEINNPSAFEKAVEHLNILNSNELKLICQNMSKAKQNLGFEVDCEWAIDSSGQLCWLQARPITTDDTPSVDEFNCKLDIDNQVITRCNVGEMLPGAVTPLSLSTSVYSIDWGMRRMFVNIGVFPSMDNIPETSCIVSIKNHLFINLTTIYHLGKKLFAAGKQGADLSICGKPIHDMPDIDMPDANLFVKIRNFIKYLFLLFSKNTAKIKIREIAKKLHFRETHSVEEQYLQLEEKMNKMHWSLYYHYITSSYSGSMSSALHIMLEKDFKDKEELKARIAGVLENIEEIESVDILRSLREIARALIKENPDVTSFSVEELLMYLNNCGEKSRKAYQYFLERHGHRAIREAEMRSKSWEDDRLMLANYLKMVISTGGKETETQKYQWKIHLEGLLSGYNPVKTLVVKYLINQARYGVQAREFSKSMIIKVIDKFKKEYRLLATRLVEQNLLSDEDCIFFLTHQEIGKLIKEKDTSLNKKALIRRRLLEEQKQYTFPEVSLGCPEPINESTSNPNTKVFKGIPVSRGLAFGKARIVKNIEDAKQLIKGEIMVAVFTDIGWSPYYCLINGLVTEVGSALSHGAVVAREYSLPLIANIPFATKHIKTGDFLSVDGNTGELRILDEKDYLKISKQIG